MESCKIMIGLMEQVKPENKRYYDTSKFDLHATRTLASNIRTYLVQEGKLLISEVFDLEPLIYSDDIESIRLAIYVMEAKTSINFTTKEDGNLE
jgi:hypothetical protein